MVCAVIIWWELYATKLESFQWDENFDPDICNYLSEIIVCNMIVQCYQWMELVDLKILFPPETQTLYYLDVLPAAPSTEIIGRQCEQLVTRDEHDSSRNWSGQTSHLEWLTDLTDSLPPVPPNPNGGITPTAIWDTYYCPTPVVPVPHPPVPLPLQVPIARDSQFLWMKCDTSVQTDMSLNKDGHLSVRSVLLTKSVIPPRNKDDQNIVLTPTT